MVIFKHNYGKSPFFMGKSTISMVIFNSYVKLPEGNLKNSVCLKLGYSQFQCMEEPRFPLKMAMNWG